MNEIFKTDWVEILFHKISLKLYEKEQEKHRKISQIQKNKIIKNNRIIVKVNDAIIYDSKKEKNMSDELFYALVSYGLMDSINSKLRNKKSPINYNLHSSISSIPALPKNNTSANVV